MIFRIDLKIVIYIIIYYFTKQIKLYIFVMIFAFIHELGHLLCGLLLKMKVKRITIMPVGFSLEFRIEEKDLNKKILKGSIIEIKKIAVAIMGPVTNIVIIFYVLFINKDFINKDLIIYSNLCIFLFNLLPIYPLDGGRILKSFFYIFLNRKKANTVIYIMSNVGLFFVSIIFGLTLFYHKNMSVIFILFYLWGFFLKEKRYYSLKKIVYKYL